MKNFTNNFKQFTSRLSARWLIMALMLLLGTSSAWGATLSKGTKIYVDVNTNSSWWAADGAEVHAYFWGSSTTKHFRMTYDNTSKYYQFTADADYDYNNVIFIRMAPNVATGTGWPSSTWGAQTGDLTYYGVNNLFTFTTTSGCWDNCRVQGTWSTYNPCATPAVPTLSADKTNLVAPDKATLTVGNTTSGLTYKLYDGATEVASKASTGSDLTFEVDEAGNYTVSVTNDCGSTSTSTPAVEITVCTPQTNEFRHANSSYAQLASQPTYYPGDKAYFVSTINCCLTGTWSNNLQKGEESWYTGLKGVTPQFYMTLTRAGNFTITNMATNGCTQDKNVKVNLDFTVTALPEVTNANGTASSSSIALTWNNSANHNNVLVVRYLSTATKTIPAGGETYSAGNTLGEGTVVYVGPDENYTDSNLSDGVSYKYYFYTVNNNYYSSGVSIEVTTCTNPNFAIQASETVAKGGQITASITGEHTPLVTWSSSNEEVATIDASGNITAIKFGQTTITATTTGEDEYCENVPQSATLTVKETPRVSITGENTICEGLKVTLTAGITDLSDGNVPTINWYKEGEDDIKKTGATYEPESTGRYYVIVTGDYINRTESGKFQFTINENPIIQSTLDNNATNVEICGTGKETTLSVTEGLASYSWGDGNTKTVNETGTYKVTATDANGCTSNEVEFNVKVLNPTVTFKGYQDQIVCSGTNANFEVELSGQTVSWKDANGTEVSTSNPFTPQIEGEAGTTYTYKVVVSEGSCSSEESTVSVTIPTIDLTVGSISGDNEICSGNATTLTLTGMVNGTVEKWLKSTDNNNYSDVSNTTSTLNTGNLTTSTYYKALVSSSVCPNHKEPTEAYLVTVNPLPTISIDGNDEAVKYEDVTLTATATNAETITWAITSGTGTLSSDTGESVKLTSNTKGTVKVKATATSTAGCSTTSSEKSVEFVEEDCSSTTKTEQQKVGKAKITCTQKPNDWTKLYCYIWTAEDKKPLGAWPGTEISANTAKIVDVNSKTFHVIFHNGSGVQTANSQELNPDKIYNLKINYSNNSHTISVEDKGTYKESVTVTVGPDITAPAVKMVSAEYNETTDKIDVVAAIYKRGCDDVEWGFQYSEDGTTWSNKIYPNSHTATVVGEVTHSFSIDGGEGNTYYIRAYAKNSNSEVTSANTKSVEIPSSIIESATISLVDREGNESTDTEVCPQSTVYLKVSYVGGDFKSFEAADNFPGTDLELVNHDKVNNYAIFSFTATATGTANITISNNSGSTVTPADGVSITLKDVQVDAPYISIYPASGIICEGSSATIKVENNPSPDCSYKLVKEGSEEEFPPYDSGDLTYTVQDVGKYYVIARHNECTANEYTSNQVAINQIIRTSAKISIEPTSAETTPWEKVSIKVIYDEGYAYDLTYPNGLDNVENVIIEQVGDTYTYSIPRPSTWGTGNANSGRTSIDYHINAKLKVDGEATQCQMSESNTTITLIDEENEVCN